MFYSSSGDDPQEFDQMREYLSPAQIDFQIRQAIQFCWLTLPKEKRTPDELERQIRRVVDRALMNFRDDFDELGGASAAPSP